MTFSEYQRIVNQLSISEAAAGVSDLRNVPRLMIKELDATAVDFESLNAMSRRVFYKIVQRSYRSAQEENRIPYVLTEQSTTEDYNAATLTVVLTQHRTGSRTVTYV